MSVTGELDLPRDALLQDSLVTRARARVVESLPAWMFLFYGCLLLNTALTNFEKSRRDLAYTAIFPLSVFVLFSAVRALKSPNVQNRLLAWAVPLALAITLPTLNLMFHKPSPVQGETLLKVYELSNFLWAALMVWHASRAKAGHVALFFGVGLLYGAVLENGGIWLGFFHETHLNLTRIPGLPAPFATMVGWCVVLYMSTFVVWRLRKWVPALRNSDVLSAFLVAAFATMLDLQIDPLATAAHCWVWHESLLPFFEGVPLVNFIAWMCALAPFAYVMFRYQRVASVRDAGRWSPLHLKRLAMAVPATLVLALCCFSVLTLLVEGPQGASWSLLFDATQKLLTLGLG